MDIAYHPPPCGTPNLLTDIAYLSPPPYGTPNLLTNTASFSLRPTVHLIYSRIPHISPLHHAVHQSTHGYRIFLPSTMRYTNVLTNTASFSPPPCGTPIYSRILHISLLHLAVPNLLTDIASFSSPHCGLPNLRTDISPHLRHVVRLIYSRISHLSPLHPATHPPSGQIPVSKSHVSSLQWHSWSQFIPYCP